MKCIMWKKGHVDLLVYCPFEGEIKQSSLPLEKNSLQGWTLSGFFRVIEVARVPWADFIDSDLQNSYWEGYAASLEVLNRSLTYLNSCIVHASIKFSGSCNDRRVGNMPGLTYHRCLVTWISLRIHWNATVRLPCTVTQQKQRLLESREQMSTDITQFP